MSHGAGGLLTHTNHLDSQGQLGLVCRFGPTPSVELPAFLLLTPSGLSHEGQAICDGWGLAERQAEWPRRQTSALSMTVSRLGGRRKTHPQCGWYHTIGWRNLD